MKPIVHFVSAGILLVLLAACGGGADLSAPPISYSHAISSESGLVQEVAVTMEEDRFRIRSELRNRGDASADVRVRACFLRSEDVRGAASRLVLEEPLMLCSTDAMDLNLAPGEVSEPLFLQGLVRPGGPLEVEVRHALDPEAWAPVTLDAPQS